jgi:hypothetical protein
MANGGPGRKAFLHWLAGWPVVLGVHVHMDLSFDESCIDLVGVFYETI